MATTLQILDGNPVYVYDDVKRTPDEYLEIEYDYVNDRYIAYDHSNGRKYEIDAVTLGGSYLDTNYIRQSFYDYIDSLKKEDKTMNSVSSLDEFMKINDARMFTKEQIETLKASLMGLKKRIDLAAEAVRISDEKVKDAEALADNYRSLAEEKVEELEKLTKKLEIQESLITDQEQTIKTLTEQIIEIQS